MFAGASRKQVPRAKNRRSEWQRSSTDRRSELQPVWQTGARNDNRV